MEEQYFKRDYDSDSNEEEDEEVKSGEKRMRTQMSGVTEKYYIEDDEWDVLPAVLNTPKSGVALCKFQH